MALTAELASFRYQAGSCTLEVSGEVSPLSQVTGKPVLRRSRFHLQLRSPQAVLLDVRGSSRGSRRSSLLVLQQAVDAYLQQYLAAHPTEVAAADWEATGVRIQPLGLTRHRMHLEHWGIAEAPSVVDLSSPQLNDLAQVLSQMDTATAILPVALPRRQRRVVSWRWAGTAASVLIVVGSLGVLWPYINQTPVPTVSEGAGNSAESQDGESQTIESLEPESLPEDEVAIAPPPAANQPPPIEAAPEAASRPSQADGGSSPAPTAPTPQSASPPEEKPAMRPAPAGAPEAIAPPEPDSSQAILSAPEASGDAAPESVDPFADNSANTALSAPSPEAARSRPEIGLTSEATPDAQAWLSALETALEERWQPPAGLDQPLRYRLAIAADGTLQNLEPQAPAARRYPNPIDTAAISLPPQPGSLPNLVEVSLYPDGSVTVTVP